MRTILIAALTALGIGLVSVSASSAMPLSGTAIAKAGELGNTVEQAHWWWPRHHRWHRRHHHHDYWHYRHHRHHFHHRRHRPWW